MRGTNYGDCIQSWSCLNETWFTCLNFFGELLEQEPAIYIEDWDQASLGYLNLPFGKCAFLGCADDVPDARRIELPKGQYAALSLAKGLESIEKEWEDADDFYKVILWPSNAKEHKVLKRYDIT